MPSKLFSLVVIGTTTSTIAPTVYTAYWNFDMNTNDLYGTYNGVLVGKFQLRRKNFSPTMNFAERNFAENRVRRK